ncbi:maltokinase N-terminal cap-like domain-containing protein [Streptomyces sp. S186]|uniref:maltokinase N-terminal cap-like domain-containing protein n=1 Tax=Streptomyces sp. S186 TaxID=3434395 RepID=UPI003F66D33C
MAVIHHTTLKPTKLQLLTTWLPGRPWYRGAGQAPQLTKAGGFRLDDPQGEVGIECLVVTDRSGDLPVTYFVPLTYRGEPLDGAEQGLIGTLEHGLLGRRWIYDGAHDPVLVGELIAVFQGRAVPQAQDVSDVRDGSVHGRLAETAQAAAVGSSRVVGTATVVDTAHGTELVLETTTEADGEAGTAGKAGGEARGEGKAAGEAVAVGALSNRGRATFGLRMERVLEALPQEGRVGSTDSAGPECLGSLTGVWQSADGVEHRGLFAALHTTER